MTDSNPSFTFPLHFILFQHLLLEIPDSKSDNLNTIGIDGLLTWKNGSAFGIYEGEYKCEEWWGSTTKEWELGNEFALVRCLWWAPINAKPDTVRVSLEIWRWKQKILVSKGWRYYTRCGFERTFEDLLISCPLIIQTIKLFFLTCSVRSSSPRTSDFSLLGLGGFSPK